MVRLLTNALCRRTIVYVDFSARAAEHKMKNNNFPKGSHGRTEKGCKMKVIKRDGRAVDYDRAKIQIAIEKANKEVKASERASGHKPKGIFRFSLSATNRKKIKQLQHLLQSYRDCMKPQIMIMPQGYRKRDVRQ